MTFPTHYGMRLLKVFARPIPLKIGHTTSISSEWLWSQPLPTSGNFLGVSPTSTHGATRESFGSILKIVKPLNTAH